MSTTQQRQPSAETQPARWDPRRFYRTSLAIIAPLPMLFMGLTYLLQPLDGEATLTDTAAFDLAHPGTLDRLQWLSVPFLMLIIPAFIAVAMLTWSRSPRRTAVALALAVPGTALSLAVNPPDTQLAIYANTFGLDVLKLESMSEAWWSTPIVLIASLWFLSGIVIGLPLLGISLWRGRITPGWMAWALIVGGATHPFIPGHVNQGIGLLVAAVGFAGASVALLRQNDDDFLPAPQAHGFGSTGSGELL